MPDKPQLLPVTSLLPAISPYETLPRPDNLRPYIYLSNETPPRTFLGNTHGSNSRTSPEENFAISPGSVSVLVNNFSISPSIQPPNDDRIYVRFIPYLNQPESLFSSQRSLLRNLRKYYGVRGLYNKEFDKLNKEEEFLSQRYQNTSINGFISDYPITPSTSPQVNNTTTISFIPPVLPNSNLTQDNPRSSDPDIFKDISDSIKEAWCLAKRSNPLQPSYEATRIESEDYKKIAFYILIAKAIGGVSSLRTRSYAKAIIESINSQQQDFNLDFNEAMKFSCQFQNEMISKFYFSGRLNSSVGMRLKRIPEEVLDRFLNGNINQDNITQIKSITKQIFTSFNVLQF